MSFDVSILIVTYNSAEQIERCLESVRRERQAIHQEIVVVDNKSTDQTVEIIRRAFPEVTLVCPGENLGFAKGVNLAARHATGEYLLLLNPDTEVRGHAIDELVRFARAHPHHGLYGGKTLKTDGRLEPSSCWARPSVRSTALFAFGITTLFPRNRWLDPESLGGWQRDTVREVGIITGCLLLVSRVAWDRLQGLNEKYFMYGEDADFCARAWTAGYRPVINPRAEVVHEVGQSSSTPLHKAILLYRGKSSYMRTHWSPTRAGAGVALLKWGVALRALAATALRRQTPVWRELWRQRRSWERGYEA